MTYHQYTPNFDGHRVIGDGDPLAGITFASSTAQDAARTAGLASTHFADHAPTGETGYTASDVRTIISETDAEPEEE